MNSVGAIQSQHAKKLSPLTEKGEHSVISGHRGTRKQENEDDEKTRGQLDKPRHVLKVDQHAFTSWNWGLPASGRSPFLPSS